MTIPTGWEGILDDGEEILWQGRPDGAVRWKVGNFVTLIFGIFFAGFALFWMAMAAKGGGGMWMFGLIHFSAGIGIAFGPPFGSAYKRRHSWYTLTGNRAIIATDTPFRGRKLISYPITADTNLGFDNEPLATVTFAEEYRRGNKRSYTVDIGFEWIEDGAEVYGLMRDIQKAAV